MDKLVINQLPAATLRGARVFVRIDTAVEAGAGENPVSEYKLRESLPTLEYLVNAHARVIIGTHLGDPAGVVDESLRVDGVAETIAALTRRPVRKLNEAIGRDVQRVVADMRPGEMVLLENLRFYPGEYANDLKFARALAHLCTIYCNDAFAIAHRPTASTMAISRFVRPAAAGLALARELMMFEAVLDKPQRPFLGIVAGARIEENS